MTSGRTDASDAFAELRARLSGEESPPLAGDPRPVRPFAPGLRMSLFLALFVPLAALILWRVFGWRPDRDVLGDLWMWGLSAAELGVALMLLGRVMREAIPGLSSSLTSLTAAAGGGLALHAAVILATFARSRIQPAAGQEWTTGLSCFTFEVALGVPCLLFALWLGGRGLTSRPRRLGLLGGVGAGLAADAVWRLICPYTAPAHAFGFHSLGVVAVAALGLAAAGGWEIARIKIWRARG